MRSGAADSSPEAILQTAKKHLQAKCGADAEQVLRDYLRSAAKSDAAAEVRLLLGQALGNQKRADEALRALAAVATSHSDTLWAALDLEESIRLYELRRNSSMAQQKRDELLKYYPESPVTLRVWAGVAEQLFGEEKYEAAVGVLIFPLKRVEGLYC
jgi:TolA-binding protein